MVCTLQIPMGRWRSQQGMFEMGCCYIDQGSDPKIRKRHLELHFRLSQDTVIGFGFVWHRLVLDVDTNSDLGDLTFFSRSDLDWAKDLGMYVWTTGESCRALVYLHSVGQRFRCRSDESPRLGSRDMYCFLEMWGISMNFCQFFMLHHCLVVSNHSISFPRFSIDNDPQLSQLRPRAKAPKSKGGEKEKELQVLRLWQSEKNSTFW